MVLNLRVECLEVRGVSVPGRPVFAMTDDSDQLKSDLRSEMRTKLAAMGETAQREASAAACAHLTGLEAFGHASVVMLYMPLADEVDLTPAALRCFQSGKTVCVPRVDWKRREMDAVEVTSFDDHIVEVDEHGIRTPREGPPLVPTLIDLVVLPGLAFDTSGNRLGRGGGYFDRYVRRLRRTATTVGLAFDVQIVDAVPVDDRDFSVNIVVTDRRVAHARRSRAKR